LNEANRFNTRCYEKHEKLSYLPKQRHGPHILRIIANNSS
jgi:hypothetical protein